MAGNEATEKFLNALNESYDALAMAVKAANDRSHRLTTALIEGAQQGQRESVHLARRWAERPLDLLGLYGSLIDAVTKAQGRTLEVSRLWLAELTEAQRESRDGWRRLQSASGSAAAATADRAKGFVRQADEATQPVSAPRAGSKRLSTDQERASPSKTLDRETETGTQKTA